MHWFRGHIETFISICIILCSITNTSFGQSHYEGHIENSDGEHIAAANVMLMQGNQMLGFAVTDKKGNFKISFDTPLDSAYLEVNHLRYDPKKIFIVAGKHFYEIQLKTRSLALPEIVVKPDPIIQKGDTLIFNVEEFKKHDEESIETVLSRMPGVEIDPNGTILFNSMPISKFYVEGLDMMEGKYRLISKNLGVKHIREVQVLKRHQHIRALDSIYKPPNAALNLKLKSEIALTGNVRAGLAFPWSGLFHGNTFGFTKRQQFHVSGSYNGIGENIKQQFTRLGASPLRLINRELIQINTATPPFYTWPLNTHNNNNEFTFGLNFLKKIGSESTIKIQGHTINDKLIKSGSSFINYAFQNDQSTFDNVLQSTENPSTYDVAMIYELNNKKYFAKLNTQFVHERNRNIAQNVFNEEASEEALFSKNFSVRNTANFVINRSNKAYQWVIKSNYDQKFYDLDIRNAFLSAPGINTTYFPELFQKAKTTDFNVSAHSTYYYTNRKGLEGQIEFAPGIMQKTILSDILDNNESSIGSQFTNDHSTKKLSLSTNHSWKYESKKNLLISIHGKISLDRYILEKYSDPSPIIKPILALSPSLFIRRTFKRDWMVSASYSFENDLQTFGEVYYDGYVMVMNRSLNRQLFQPIPFTKHATSGALVYFNVMNGIDFNFSGYFSRLLADQLEATDFNSIGTISSIGKIKNVNDNYGISTELIHKPLGPVDYKLSMNYNYSTSPRLINNVLFPFTSSYWKFDASTTYTSDIQSTTLGFSYIQDMVSTQVQSNDQMRLKFQQYWQISDRLSFSIMGQSALYKFAKTQEWSNIVNANFAYKFGSPEISAKLTIVNLLNESVYTTYHRSAFGEYRSNYVLNPRRVQITLKRNF